MQFKQLLPTVFSLTAIACLCLCGALSAVTIHVPGVDGITIQEGIDMSEDGDTVKVADGIYDEKINFCGKEIAVVGNPEYPAAVVIDGNSDGSVVSFISQEPRSSLLSGFTIRNGTGTDYFEGNYAGGGIFIVSSSPTVEDCIIEENEVSNVGGGIFAHLTPANPLFKRCVIRNNHSGNSGGGAVMDHQADAVFDHCQFSSNSAVNGGAFMSYSSETEITILNCTFSGNQCDHQGFISIGGDDRHVTFVNTIFWNNDPAYLYYIGGRNATISVSYSDIETIENWDLTNYVEGWGYQSAILNGGIGNIDSNPLFVDPDNGNFHLQSHSPCINTGDPNSSQDPDGSRADMGAYPYNIQAGDVHIDWFRTYDNTNRDNGHALIEDANGGFTILGATQSYTYAYLLQTDEDGGLLWDQYYNQAQGGYAGYSLIQLPNDGYSLAGASRGGRMWLAEVENDGDFVWQNQYGGGLEVCDHHLLLDNGDYLLAGYSEVYRTGRSDAYLVRTNAQGGVVWAHNYNYSWSECIKHLIELPDGNYLGAGWTSSSDSYSSVDGMLLKITPDGNRLLMQHFQMNDYNSFFDICESQDGNYIAAGFAGAFGQSAFPDVDFYAAKVTENGDVIWSCTYGGSGYEMLSSIIPTQDGNYILTGYTTSFALLGRSDLWQVKIDENGDSLDSWVLPIVTDQGNSVCSNCVQLEDGSYAITGWSGRFQDNGNIDYSDVLLVKTTPDVGNPPTPDITVLPLSLDFGSVEIYESAGLPFTITNEGDGVLHINSIDITGEYFSIPVIDPFDLQPLEDTVITVTFAPETNGAVTGSVTIFSDDPDEPAVPITLDGSGYLHSLTTVIHGFEGVWLKEHAEVLSGDVWVNNDSQGPYLAESVELTVGIGVDVNCASIRADKIKMKDNSVVNADVHYNELTNNGTINGNEITPVNLPLIPSEYLPYFPSDIESGETDYTVSQNGSLVLEPGFYGDLLVRLRGTVTFTGGEYVFNSIDGGDQVNFLFDGASTVKVADKFDTDQNSYFGPAENSGITARDIIVYVAGQNGGNGNLGATPKAVQIGLSNDFQANVYAPNGTVWIRQNTDSKGSFIGKWVILGEGATAEYDGIFEYDGHSVAGRDVIALQLSSNLPAVVYLDAAYPNPFNSSTTIKYALPEAAQITLSIYDISGRQVETLVNHVLPAGYHTAVWNAGILPAGVYFIKFTAGEYNGIQKLLLVK